MDRRYINILIIIMPKDILCNTRNTESCGCKLDFTSCSLSMALFLSLLARKLWTHVRMF